MSAPTRPHSGWLGATPRQSVIAGIVLACVAAVLLLRLEESPLVRSSEKKCYAVAQHMLATGDWLVPVYEGGKRFQKPPLYYWAAAATALPSGELSRLGLRLPAALAALGLLAVVFCWGREVGGLATGVMAAMCLLGMVQYWSLGRRGDAEMPLAFFTTLALYLFVRIYWAGRRDWLPMFFLALLLGFLAKATAALLLIGVPIGLQLARDRAFSRLLRRDIALWGGLCVVGCLAWYALLIVAVPESRVVLTEALLLPTGMAKSIGSSQHVRPLWWHLPNLVSATLPALLVAPLLFSRVGRGSTVEPRMRFVLVALVALFVCFSVIPMKQKHYMLPLLPLLAILLGHMLHALYEHDRDLLERFVRQLGRAVVVAAPILAVLSVAHLRFVNDGSIAFAILVASLIIAFGALGFTTSRRGRLRGFVAASLALFGVVNLVSLASFEIWRDRFKADAFAEIPDFDAAQWQVVFERNPVVRNIYQASRWRIEDGAAAPTETLRQDL